MPRIGVVGATGAVGSVLRSLLAGRDDVRYFASARSAGQTLDGKQIEETTPDELDLEMKWDFDGEEFDEESKLRAETQKILELPELPVQATCVRVPVMVGHSEAVWVETEQPLSPERARELFESSPGIRVL